MLKNDNDGILKEMVAISGSESVNITERSLDLFVAMIIVLWAKRAKLEQTTKNEMMEDWKGTCMDIYADLRHKTLFDGIKILCFINP